MIVLDLLAELDDGSIDLEVVAHKVLDRLLPLEPSALRSELVPIIFDVARRERRAGARAIERSVTSSSSEAVDPADARRRFLAEHVYCGADRGYVLMGDATAADHRARADYLRLQAAGVLRTAEIHDRAAALITRKRVRCLSDLGEKFDPKELES